ncbi:hypothetical protein [Chitinophaga sp. CF418]|uniref:hypothetical protein n=1 Tax=Chitinophaga sp. CF418 TaxID=1855287 RepID=UPI0009126692|nr:hypothetical protein [Chitinophaga sp. CF418]SHN36611.1 hypothetical protein SAMN05216311_110121 [Chitinophaga sp. CF418]
MKPILVICTILLAFSACKQHKDSNPAVIELTYQQADIQKQFDTLYNHQQADSGVYSGLIEQALAICHDSTGKGGAITQDVFSSMYYNLHSRRYDCVTTTVFQLPDGSISAIGLFNLTPGDTIAPDHDFPVTGGSGAYHDISGTYTRKYRDGVYHVRLSYYKTEQH